jgi:hypothetical protein
MVIALIICIPVAILLTGIIVLKSVQLGLRWQLQAAEKQEPVMHNPVTEAVQQKKDEKAREEAKTFIEEVLYGERR